MAVNIQKGIGFIVGISGHIRKQGGPVVPAIAPDAKPLARELTDILAGAVVTEHKDLGGRHAIIQVHAGEVRHSEIDLADHGTHKVRATTPWRPPQVGVVRIVGIVVAGSKVAGQIPAGTDSRARGTQQDVVTARESLRGGSGQIVGRFMMQAATDPRHVLAPGESPVSAGVVLFPERHHLVAMVAGKEDKGSARLFQIVDAIDQP